MRPQPTPHWTLWQPAGLGVTAVVALRCQVGLGVLWLFSEVPRVTPVSQGGRVVGPRSGFWFSGRLWEASIRHPLY